MSEDKIIAGESSLHRQSNDSIIGSDGIKSSKQGSENAPDILTLKERISISTESGGLTDPLPIDFDDKEGDWQVIKSDNPFEILYLDYKQAKLLTSELVKSNFEKLKKFWENKIVNMNVGGNRSNYKLKYGSEDLVSNSVTVLNNAFNKIKTKEGIENYFIELEKLRLKIGEQSIQPLIRMMVKDDVADQSEIEGIFSEGGLVELNEDEICQILKRVFDEKKMLPYKKASGKTLKENLLSTDWMTEEKFHQRKIDDENKKEKGVELLGKKAHSLNELGEFLLDDEKGAKEYIKEDVLKGSISFFSADKAMEYINIVKEKKSDHLKYLRIVYRLNPVLPFKISDKKVLTTKELSKVSFENPKIGKEQFKQGNIEVWFEETQKDAFKKLVAIRDTAENFELAFLEFVYTFNSELPYRFSEKFILASPEELALKIDENKENWEKGKEELYEKYILVWLEKTKWEKIVKSWNEYKNGKEIDIKKLGDPIAERGLEDFLHLLNLSLPLPELTTSVEKIEFIKIPSGKVVEQELVLTNSTRGYLESNISFSADIDGVKISNKNIICSRYHNGVSQSIKLQIDSQWLKKGMDYKTSLEIKTNTNRKYSIPILLRIVFPKRAFVFELLKYAALFSAFFGLIRYFITTMNYNYPLSTSFDYYLDAGTVSEEINKYQGFGVFFSLMSISLLLGLYVFTRYILRRPKTSSKK